MSEELSEDIMQQMKQRVKKKMDGLVRKKSNQKELKTTLAGLEIEPTPGEIPLPDPGEMPLVMDMTARQVVDGLEYFKEMRVRVKAMHGLSIMLVPMQRAAGLLMHEGAFDDLTNLDVAHPIVLFDEASVVAMILSLQSLLQRLRQCPVDPCPDCGGYHPMLDTGDD